MAVKIDQRIKSFRVIDARQRAAESEGRAQLPVQPGEPPERPAALAGTTYRIESPHGAHALYVTLNDILLDAGTPQERRRPFEIFIHAQDMEHCPWRIALARIMSAVLRQGGDCTFLVEELKAVSDPRGGYLKPDGVYMPSSVAEIGAVLERHLSAIGLLRQPRPDAARQRHFAERRAAWQASQDAAALEPGKGFPPGASRCEQCHTPAVVKLEGCATCLNCGHSQCG